MERGAGLGSPARTRGHVHAVITQVFICIEFLLGAGVSEVNETALALRKHKLQRSRIVPAYAPDMLQLPRSSGKKTF